MNGRACICMSVCLSRLKSWITFEWIKGYCRNIHEQSNSVQIIFGLVSQISQLPGYGPWANTAIFEKIYLLLSKLVMKILRISGLVELTRNNLKGWNQIYSRIVLLLDHTKVIKNRADSALEIKTVAWDFPSFVLIARPSYVCHIAKS